MSFHPGAGVHIYIEPWSWAEIGTLVDVVYTLGALVALGVAAIRMRRQKAPTS